MTYAIHVIIDNLIHDHEFVIIGTSCTYIVVQLFHHISSRTCDEDWRLRVTCNSSTT